MTTDLPLPPVPADADLTDFKFMPLEIGRLRRSKAWLLCKRRPELAFFMLNLWTAAWHERPAGSLESDDDVLADAAMCSPEYWAKVRKDVLRGWSKASDGRLYHPTVAEKVIDSWHAKLMARWRQECGRIRKENHRRKERNETGLEQLDFPPEPPRLSLGRPWDIRGTSHDGPAENALKGREGKGREGKGSKGKGDSREREAHARSRSRRPPPDDAELFTPREPTVALPIVTPKPKEPAHAQGRRLAEDWQPTPAERDFAADLGLDPQATSEHFADYWHQTAGARGRKVDWTATWRIWCRREVQDRRPGGPARLGAVRPARGGGLTSAFVDLAAHLEAKRRGGA